MNSGIIIGTHVCSPSPWDTDYFGIESGKVRLNGALSSDDLRTLEGWARGFDFVTIYNTESIPENNWILAKSALRPFLADVNVAFLRDLSLNGTSYVCDPSILVAHSSDRDDGVISVAASCFTCSRFYNDPNITYDKARGIYVHWVSNAFNKADRYFAKAQIQGVSRGFVLFTVNTMEKTSIIELIGVSPQLKGRGIGSSMLNQLFFFLCDLGVTRVTVGTQITNVGAVRFYQRHGFVYKGCTSVFHVWPRKAGCFNNV
jgi:ribosomal protein S18 acetylase RimI-like enzyme